MTNVKTWLLATAAIGIIGGEVALAQTAPVFDPDQLPEIKGVVAQYDLTPRGDVDGLILKDGTEVHLPPHLSTALVATVKPGDAVTIHGLHAKALPLVQAMSITSDASGKTVVDEGALGRHPHGPRGPGQDIEVKGVVKQQLHGPGGELNGVLLNNGAIVHFPPPEAKRIAETIAVGKTVVVRGEGSEGVLGKSVLAHAIGPDADKLTAIAQPLWPHMGYGPEHLPGHPELGHPELGHPELGGPGHGHPAMPADAAPEAPPAQPAD